MRRISLLLILSFMGTESNLLFAPSVLNTLRAFEEKYGETPPPYNTLHGTAEQTPPTAPPPEPNPVPPTSPDHLVNVALPKQPYNPESTKQSCEKMLQLTTIDRERRKALDAAFKLGKRYQLADAKMRRQMDGTLRELVLQGLQSESTDKLLQQSFPFLEHYIETQNDTDPLRKALRDALDRELGGIQNLYQALISPSDETLRDGENQILPDTESLLIQCGKKVLKAIERERLEKLRKESKRIFVAQRPHFNHAYLLQKDKLPLLAALYKHLPWRQKFALWHDLRQMRTAKEKARKRYYGGLIHMFQ